VNGVVGEARERVGNEIDVHFGLVGIGKPENALGKVMQLRL
jgi:hypothetical protein